MDPLQSKYYIDLGQPSYYNTDFNKMLDYMVTQIEFRSIPNGDMVGIVAAQSISERFTQTTLNSFHIAGTKREAAQMGIKRVVELLDVLKLIKQQQILKQAMLFFRLALIK